MKQGVMLLGFILISLSMKSQDCFTRLQKAFDERGAYAVANDIHKNVYIAFFEDGSSRCVLGKVRVENEFVIDIYLQYADDTYELMDVKFYNAENQPPAIINGISEMIYTSEGAKFKVVFIDNLKPREE
jgi:hypothetical protein